MALQNTTTFNIKPILSNIQHNCNIADAKYAGNFTLCIYLLKMREFFRWEKGFGYSSSLSQSEIGQWLISQPLKSTHVIDPKEKNEQSG